MMNGYQTGCVTTEGDDLYYEVRGSGEPLLMIPGGGGDAGFYSLVAPILAREYKVITYDRRANSRSTRHEPQNFDMAQQSRDAVAVLNAVGESSAFVFGNSGGAVIALDMAKTQPQAVRAAVVHEPPILRVLPNAEKHLRFFAMLYQMSFWLGTGLTMLRFGLSLGIPLRVYRSMPKDFGKRTDHNDRFFLRHEMLAFTNYLPDVAAIQRNGVKILMAAGEKTLENKLYYGVTAPILAKQLGCEMVTLPGWHISYLETPDEWAASLRNILHKAA